MSETGSVVQRRIVIGAGLCVMAFALVGLRLVDVTLLRGSGDLRLASEHPVISRADLVDRDGELIARDIPVADLYARPHALADKRAAAHALALATGADEARLAAMFAGRRPYVLVARQISTVQQNAVKHLALPGLEFEASAKRYYPGGRATAQVVGVTDPDNKGVSGLELGLEDRLRGETAPVQTSLDMRVQFILAHEAAAAREEFRAKAAGGIVMDVDTGEVLGLVSLPDFDPNARTLDAADSERNIMAQDVYELGSVFKIFSFTLGFEDRTMRPDEMFKVGNGFKIGRYTIHEAEHMPAMLAARDVLALSSNIGTAQIALRSGPDRQRAFLTHMGLLEPVRSELPETARPLYPDHWGTIETATIGFGHGISVSPLAFVAAAAAVVNGGRQVTPTFLKHPEDGRGAQLIRPETSVAMRGLLRYVVTNGTGKKADVPGYDVGGKTGSAEIAGRHGYQAHTLITSFCAIFPVDQPRYLVFVMLDEPHGDKTTDGFALAGYTAAPLAGRVIAHIAPLLGVPQRAPPPVTVARENS